MSNNIAEGHQRRTTRRAALEAKTKITKCFARQPLWREGKPKKTKKKAKKTTKKETKKTTKKETNKATKKCVCRYVVGITNRMSKLDCYTQFMFKSKQR
jgi:hypothetical protein